MHKPRRRTSLLASCLAATAVLLVVAAALAVVAFTLLRPHDPTISVDAIHLPAFYPSSNGTASFTFEQRAAVRNPNREALSHYDSSVLVTCCGGERVGFAFIPAGEIGGGRTQHVAATLAVGAVEVAEGREVVVETRMRLRGRVRVLSFLTHRVEATQSCRVGLSAQDGSVLGLQCL